jgi:hypothetical protein
MRRGFEAEKVFNENLDRLLAEQSITTDAIAEEDTRTALEFANRMAAIRPVPSSSFQANLKARLLQQLNEQEAIQETKSWWWKLIPRQPAWQAAAILAFIIIVGGIVWGTQFRSSPSPVANIPPQTGITYPAASSAPAKTAAPSMSAAPASSAPATTAAPASSAPSVIASQILRADASTSKAQYAANETVNISMSWQNVTPQTITIAEFPPILSIMQSSNNRPAYTFAAGKNPVTLAPGQTATATLTWNQTDAQGRAAAPGSYYLELEELYYQGRQVPMNLSRLVTFNILPVDSSSTGAQRVITVNQSQTANGITVTLQNIRVTDSGFTVSAFITPPSDYVLQAGTPAVSPTQDYWAAAGYSFDANLTRGAGVPSVQYFSSGMNQSWFIPGQIPPGTSQLTFIVNSVGKWSGHWQFQVSVK